MQAFRRLFKLSVPMREAVQETSVQYKIAVPAPKIPAGKKVKVKGEVWAALANYKAAMAKKSIKEKL
ncbi:unnamed protein product [Blepharisma stoltei]|uniref:Uncharacterized protein n=1 Tax=Blepharisma stoltei TaxID=1481888 RepID=A0AAU9JKE5_9CILI|nr:unnamed protein product [Blepharisma stoltei]